MVHPLNSPHVRHIVAPAARTSVSSSVNALSCAQNYPC